MAGLAHDRESSGSASPYGPRTQNELPILIVADVDPDWRIPNGSGTPFKGEFQWRGLTEGVPRMLQRVEEVRDTSGRKVRFTWLLRSDDQVASLLGDGAFLANEFAEFWRQRLAEGDEIGWHPHTWRFSERHRVWYQEQRDVDCVRTCFRDGHRALSRHFRIRSAKPGWMYHDATTMGIFDELGIEVDLAAVPGVSFSGMVPGTDLPLRVYDWLDAPQEPYHPSARSYQRPGAGNALRLLEVPNWTFPIGLVRRTHHRLRDRAARDFANPAKLPFLVRNGFGKPPSTVPFVCSFHPEDLLGRSALFGGGYVLENLRLLLRACTNRGITTRMTVGSELTGPASGWIR
jgi:hypothetical protein